MSAFGTRFTEEQLEQMAEAFDRGQYEIVSDQELRAFLAAQGYDPKTQPYFCAEVVQERYDVPLWIAQQWVDQLR